MAEQDRATRELAVLIPEHIKQDFGYGHQVFEYSVATVDANTRVRNCSDSDDAPFCAFADLTFRTQISGNFGDLKPYAFSLEYRGIHSLDLRRAESCIKMLRKIDKASEAFPVRPETFGQYVAMMAKALKITGALQTPENGGRWHDETQYIRWAAKDIQLLIDRQIGEFIEKHGEAMKDSARR